MNTSTGNITFNQPSQVSGIQGNNYYNTTAGSYPSGGSLGTYSILNATFKYTVPSSGGNPAAIGLVTGGSLCGYGIHTGGRM
jgi:hypothetical protein